ncbi:MAG: Glycerol-3-phosphate acyltransferase [Deltaproteobacteria bacterium ADurb.Bin510]|nr:MAG: Glycerol-3-phosphate acyltransferase [Deltaproteobacteria bacterium ADurb.Bin510]
MLSYALYFNWMSVPYIAAGVNLSFFPVGTLLRNCGAFFMRRSFHNDPVYSQTFSAYIRTVLAERIPFEFFIEGTRSRSGKLMMPKKGLLSMIVQGWEAGLSPDVIFVPLYVGYDTVVEESSYISEMQGGEKQKESFWQLLRAGRILKNRYGKVYVRFAEPLSLNEFMQNKRSYGQMETGERQELYDDLALNLIDAIYKQTVATPFAIISAVLISQVAAIEEAAARRFFALFTDYLRATGYNLASSLNDVNAAFDDTLSLMIERGLVTIDRGEGPDEPNLCLVPADKRIHLEYYKNNVLNCFTPAALIACVILKHPEGLNRENFMTEVKFLAELLKNEFILDMQAFAKALDYMIKSGYIIRDSRFYTPAGDATETLRMLAGLIENYLESYLTVAHHIERLARKSTKDALKIIDRRARRMHKKGEIARAETLCLPTYKGALDSFRSLGLIGSDNEVIDRKGMERIRHALEAYHQN